MKFFYQVLTIFIFFGIWKPFSAVAQKTTNTSTHNKNTGTYSPDFYPCPPINGTLSASTDNGPVGGIAGPNNLSYAEVDIYTPVTITANGDLVSVYVWSTIYASTGPNSYTSSQSGNQLFIAPLEPSSLYAPNGTMNGDQYYDIGCTMTSRCNGTSEYVGYGLYSIPMGAPQAIGRQQ